MCVCVCVRVCVRECVRACVIRVFCPRAGPALLAQEPRLQFCRRQVFHRKLRNQAAVLPGINRAVASRCFPLPLSL